jgi:hypothetical protein
VARGWFEPPTFRIRHDTPGRVYYQRKRAAGKSHKEALRCLKRQLSDAVYRRLVRDAHPTRVRDEQAVNSKPATTAI